MSEATETAMPLLSDFVQERYLPFAQENKRSWKADKGNLEHHVLPYLGASRLSDISTETLMEWVRTLELVGLSYSSRFRLFWLVKAILHCAVQWGVLPDSRNFASANLPAKPTRTPILLDSFEVIRLLDVLRDFPHRAAANAIHLMLLTGACKSEILYARWEDVDFKNGTLFTDKTFTGRPHLIPLNNEALKLIQKLPRVMTCRGCSSRAMARALRPSPTSGSRCARYSAAPTCESRTCAIPSPISLSASASTSATCAIF